MQKNSGLKREEQMKQRGSVPHLPIRDYCPHPSNHLKRRLHLPFQLDSIYILFFRVGKRGTNFLSFIRQNQKIGDDIEQRFGITFDNRRPHSSARLRNRFRIEGKSTLALFDGFPLRVAIPKSVAAAMQARTERIAILLQMRRYRRPRFDELPFIISPDAPAIKNDEHNF